jgi:integrase
MRVLSAEQSRIFLASAVKTHYGAVFAFALTPGMRPSEYMGLQWPDIDWERGTVGIVRTLEKVKTVGVLLTQSAIEAGA